MVFMKSMGEGLFLELLMASFGMAFHVRYETKATGTMAPKGISTLGPKSSYREMAYSELTVEPRMPPTANIARDDASFPGGTM